MRDQYEQDRFREGRRLDACIERRESITEEVRACKEQLAEYRVTPEGQLRTEVERLRGEEIPRARRDGIRDALAATSVRASFERDIGIWKQVCSCSVDVTIAGRQIYSFSPSASEVTVVPDLLDLAVAIIPKL